MKTITFTERIDDFKNILKSFTHELFDRYKHQYIIEQSQHAAILKDIENADDVVSAFLQSREFENAVRDSLEKRVSETITKATVSAILEELIKPLYYPEVHRVTTPIGVFLRRIRGGYEMPNPKGEGMIDVPRKATIGYRPANKVKEAMDV